MQLFDFEKFEFEFLYQNITRVHESTTEFKALFIDLKCLHLVLILCVLS